MHSYIALIHKDADSDFGVSFPDFPGCITAGSTLQEAMDMAREALALHIEGMVEAGQPIPEPSPLDAIMADAENHDGTAVLVPMPDGPVIKTVRVNITLPGDTLREVDAFAEQKGYTRSGLIAAALRDKMTDFSVNPWERTILHVPTITAWRYDAAGTVMIAYRSNVSDEQLEILTTLAEKRLLDERNRPSAVKGTWWRGAA